MIIKTWKRIRAGWTRSDTILLVINTCVFAFLIANCWWESVYVTYLTVIPAQLLLLWRSKYDEGHLKNALLFGCIVGILWPFGEYFVVNVFGWWGEYLAPGPKLLETPLYCIIIGCLTSTHCYYVGARTTDLGYSRLASGVMSGVSALLLGVIGENLFVASKMWVYDTSTLDWWNVPAFVPIAYGLSYATIPLLRKFHIVPATLIFTLITLIVSVLLGLLFGFFPRPL